MLQLRVDKSARRLRARVLVRRDSNTAHMQHAAPHSHFKRLPLQPARHDVEMAQLAGKRVQPSRASCLNCSNSAASAKFQNLALETQHQATRRRRPASRLRARLQQLPECASRSTMQGGRSNRSRAFASAFARCSPRQRSQGSRCCRSRPSSSHQTRTAGLKSTPTAKAVNTGLLFPNSAGVNFTTL